MVSVYWVIGITVYLVAGSFFNVSGYKWYDAILLRVFWLPLAIVIMYQISKSERK